MIKMRLPTDEEWDKLMDVVHDDNSIAHWEFIFSWVDSPESENIYLPSYVRRGYNSARHRDYRGATVRRWTDGFRPAFELPKGAEDARDGDIIPIGTLFMDGEPVRVPRIPVFHGDITPYQYKAKLTMGESVDDPEYVLSAIAVGGVFIADRVLLSDISFNDVKKAIL